MWAAQIGDGEGSWVGYTFHFRHEGSENFIIKLISCLDENVSKALRTVPISLSQAPPMWLEWGTFILNVIHSHSFLSKYSCILSWSIPAKAYLSSFCAPTKFIPMSGRSCLTGPRQFRNLLSALMNEEVSCELAVSKCTLLDAIHVNKTPERLTSLFLSLMMKGSK